MWLLHSLQAVVAEVRVCQDQDAALTWWNGTF